MVLINRCVCMSAFLCIRVSYFWSGTECDSLWMRGEDSWDKNRQRELFSPTNLNGSGSSQPAGTHEILFDCCNPSHLLTHRDVCVCVFGVYSWDLASCDNTGREKRELLLDGIFLPLGAARSTDADEGWLRVSFRVITNSHSTSFRTVPMFFSRFRLQ